MNLAKEVFKRLDKDYFTEEDRIIYLNFLSSKSPEYLIRRLNKSPKQMKELKEILDRKFKDQRTASSKKATQYFKKLSHKDSTNKKPVKKDFYQLEEIKKIFWKYLKKSIVKDLKERGKENSIILPKDYLELLANVSKLIFKSQTTKGIDIILFGKAGTGKTEIGKAIKYTLNSIGYKCNFKNYKDDFNTAPKKTDSEFNKGLQYDSIILDEFFEIKKFWINYTERNPETKLIYSRFKLNAVKKMTVYITNRTEEEIEQLLQKNDSTGRVLSRLLSNCYFLEAKTQFRNL